MANNTPPLDDQSFPCLGDDCAPLEGAGPDLIPGIGPPKLGDLGDFSAAKSTPLYTTPEEYGGGHRPPGPNGGAPLHDLTGGGRVYPDDVYGPNAARFYGHGDRTLDRETLRILHALRGKPNALVVVYRAVPAVYLGAKINSGDWVTVNRQYAVEHGARFDEGAWIISKRVKAHEVFTNGDSIHEAGYWSELAQSLLPR